MSSHLPLDLEFAIRAALARVEVAAFRVAISTSAKAIRPTLIRGLWGAALREVDHDAYTAVFEGAPPNHVSRYVWRSVLGLSVDGRCELELLLFDVPRASRASWRVALDQALRCGVGRDRRPATLMSCTPLDVAGELDPSAIPFRLDPLPWPIIADPGLDPCRLHFISPVRLLRHGRLIECPSLVDVVVTAWRRVIALQPDGNREDAVALQPLVLEAARALEAGEWRGGRGHVTRWSASQGQVIDLEGVIGSLQLPQGPGPLAPLLVALDWLHVGKSASLGLGRAVLDDVD